MSPQPVGIIPHVLNVLSQCQGAKLHIKKIIRLILRQPVVFDDMHNVLTFA